MRLTILLGLVLLSTSLFSQARVVFSSDVYVVLDNGANVVLDNPATTAITNTGFGRIISESEDNILKWKIGSAIGVYQIPFRSTNGTPANTADDESVLIRYEPTGGGDAAGSIKFSTYNTNSNNLPWTSDITHFTQYNNPALDNSLFVADRFYIVDPEEYSTKPNITLALFWSNNEVAAPNTIAAGNLKAQRFNSTIGFNGLWQDLLPIGNITLANRVGPFAVSAGDFFRSWVLVDNSSPLPIELLDFGANCDDQRVKIYWSTASETNNNFFEIFKSKDGLDWELVQQVASTGNSTTTINYEIWDAAPHAGVSFYKLAQTDMNGIETTYGPVSNTCGDFLFEIVSVVSDYNSNGGYIDINVSAGHDEVFDIQLIDLSGKVVASMPHQKLYSGMNSIALNKGNIAMGAYVLQLTGKAHVLTSKVLLN